MMTPISSAVALLHKHHVENVLVGGAAALVHGSAQVTQDIDFCCRWDNESLERLAEALNSIHPKLRVDGVPEGVPVTFDVKYLRQYQSVSLDTDIGYLDVRKYVDGIGGYDKVLALSEKYETNEHSIQLMTLDGLIQSKSHMGRPRDLMILPELKMMREARSIESQANIEMRDSRSGGR